MVACDTVPSYSTLKCTSTCSDSVYGSTHTYASDKHFAKSSYSVKGVENMQTELMLKVRCTTTSSCTQVYENQTRRVRLARFSSYSL